MVLTPMLRPWRRKSRYHRADVVRMFPDYGDTVLWYPNPVPYNESGLDAALVAELRAWEASYYACLDDFEWRNRKLESAFNAQGARLAGRVAGALGSMFAVALPDGRIVRASGPPTSPAAAAAFSAIAAQQRPEQERIVRIRRDSATLPWSAAAPMAAGEEDRM
jgi:hypothetical protein